MLRVAVIGAGFVGQKRALAVSKDSSSKLSLICDIDADLARDTAERYGCKYVTKWQQAISDDSLDIIIISTINKYLMPISISSLENGKHVLVEKPPGRNALEARKIVDASYKSKEIIKVGFNHRYHPAYIKLVQLLKANEIGEIYYIKSSYGHGGRPGYDNEWRADPDLAGGGEMLDQGIHIIDLSRSILGDFCEVFGYAPSYFWQVEPLEDNGFALLKNHSGQILSLHASWTQWKNVFRFELFGEKGYLIMEGLGGSYGKENLRLGKRKPESGPPDETVFEFDSDDQSWQLEWEEFTNAILYNSNFQANVIDGMKAVEIVDAIYHSNQTGEKVLL